MGRHTQSLMGLSLVVSAACLLIVSGLAGAASEKARLAIALGLLSLTGLGLGLGLQRDAAGFLRQLLIWSATVVLFGVLLSYRGEFKDAALSVFQAPTAFGSPAAVPESDGPRRVTLRAEAGGHFFARALVDGTAIDFLIDTGATDVALSQEDALRLGIDLTRLDYSIPIIAANGRTFAAKIELAEIMIGGIRVGQVTALVPRGELSYSLLGMSFLKRLTGFQMDSDRLVLRQ